jgi:hypothetical protein
MLSQAAGAVFWGVVANVVYDATIRHDLKPEIVINTNEVIIKQGNDTIIIPRAVHDATENAKKNPAVRRGLEQTFEPLAADKNVTDFGLTSSIDDPEPLVRIPRGDFPLITSHSALLDELPSEKIRTENARLVILKAWLNHAKRKWSFEWNGVPISAPITDKDFLDRLDRREYLLGAGDALDVEITFRQVLDQKLGFYVTEPNSYFVTKVIRSYCRILVTDGVRRQRFELAI